MDLILWRHAEAGPGEADLTRKLTAKGDKQARRVAEWLNGRLPETAKVYASPARRAQQTALALAEVSHRKFKTREGLAPSGTADDLLEAVGWNGGKGTLVVVGHQPALGQAASRLIIGRETDWPIKKGGLVWISQRDGGTGVETVIRAVISPDLA